MLPVLWGANKIDFTKEDNVIASRALCHRVGIMCLVFVRCGLSRAQSEQRRARAESGRRHVHLSDADKGTDGTVSVRVYDNAKLGSRCSSSCRRPMSLFVHFQWGYTQPLIIWSARAICRSHRTLSCVFQFSPLSRGLSPPPPRPPELHAADADPHQPGDARERARQGGRAAVHSEQANNRSRSGPMIKGRGGRGGREEGRVSRLGERRAAHTTSISVLPGARH